MTSAAAEVSFRCTQLMMSGRMSAPDAVAIQVGKAMVFGDASQLATVAAISGGDALVHRPRGARGLRVKARANAERLRR